MVDLLPCIYHQLPFQTLSILSEVPSNKKLDCLIFFFASLTKTSTCCKALRLPLIDRSFFLRACWQVLQWCCVWPFHDDAIIVLVIYLHTYLIDSKRHDPSPPGPSCFNKFNVSVKINFNKFMLLLSIIGWLDWSSRELLIEWELGKSNEDYWGIGRA